MNPYFPFSSIKGHLLTSISKCHIFFFTVSNHVLLGLALARALTPLTNNLLLLTGVSIGHLVYVAYVQIISIDSLLSYSQLLLPLVFRE